MFSDHYQAIYLSPHLDDVALSCGGQVFQQTQAGASVLIVTLTAADAPNDNLPPFAEAHHASWQLDAQAVANRRAEDVAACRLLGADWVHLSIMDAIYRRDPRSGTPLYESDETLFGEVNSAEIPLLAQIAEQLRKLPSADSIISPLTVGNHVDHVLMRQAAEQAFGDSLHYYEDYPYCHWHGLGNKVNDAWVSETMPISADALAAKIAAVAAYNSQVDHLFEDTNTMRTMLNAYTKEVGGERVWQKRGNVVTDK